MRVRERCSMCALAFLWRGCAPNSPHSVQERAPLALQLPKGQHTTAPPLEYLPDAQFVHEAARAALKVLGAH